jgi:hypothetical protein
MNKAKNTLFIIIVWLMALSMVYAVYVKFRLLMH